MTFTFSYDCLTPYRKLAQVRFQPATCANCAHALATEISG